MPDTDFPPLSATGDVMMDTRLAVARIEGMLSVRLAQLDRHELLLGAFDARLNEKGKDLARHDERLKDLEESTSGRLARVTAIIAAVVAVLGSAIAVSNWLRIQELVGVGL